MPLGEHRQHKMHDIKTLGGKQTAITNFYSGTSGLVLPVRNKSMYPTEFQDKSRLNYYASLFNSIEINSSFYKIPQAKTVANWANDVPVGFKFTFKLWREITHNNGLAFKPDDVHRFINVINGAGNKAGSLLVQLPPSTKISALPQLINLIYHIREADPSHAWQTAVEFRDKSWYRDDVLQIISENKMAIVLHDIPASTTPLQYATADFVYLRFHGPDGKYRGSYADDILQEYATYIHEWLDDSKRVYTHFNNTIGDALVNLTTLNTMVRNTYD